MNTISSDDQSINLEKHHENIWREFQVDPLYSELRKCRKETWPEVKVLKEEFKEFTMGVRELTFSSVERLRANLLRRLQLQNHMESLLSDLLPKYYIVSARMKDDYGTMEDLHYLQKVNGWLALVGGEKISFNNVDGMSAKVAN